MPNIEEAIIDLIKLLNQHKVRYMIVGAVAVGFYGFMRATHDIDFWVEYTPTKINDILAKHNYKLKKEYPEHNVYVKDDIEFDIFFGFPMLDFDSSYKSRKKVSVSKVRINIISKEDLVLTKSFGKPRSKDLIDIEEITKSQPPTPKGVGMFREEYG